MIPSIAIIGRETGEGKRRPVSRPSVCGKTHSNSKRGVVRNQPRNSAGYQPLRKRAGGSDDRVPLRAGIPPNLQFLPAIHFQSVACHLRADTGALIAVLPADRARFKFVRAVSVARHLIPSLRIQPAKQSRGGVSECFQSLSCAVFHDRNSNTGLRAWRAEKLSLSSRNWSVRS